MVSQRESCAWVLGRQMRAEHYGRLTVTRRWRDLLAKAIASAGGSGLTMSDPVSLAERLRRAHGVAARCGPSGRASRLTVLAGHRSDQGSSVCLLWK